MDIEKVKLTMEQVTDIIKNKDNLIQTLQLEGIMFNKVIIFHRPK